MLKPELENAYISILREELVPATGCTEPIAIAYAAARLRALLGAAPERVLCEVSGNMIKNAKSVVVPSTGGLKGIPAAVRFAHAVSRFIRVPPLSGTLQSAKAAGGLLSLYSGKLFSRHPFSIRG